MSRAAKWKLDNTKIKVVFRLQFHATHIPQSGWDKLFITLLCVESGKATAKTTKANVRNGTCKWADPIYETTRLIQDFKSKQYEEKLYKLVVAMGSSRAAILGEATINLAEYADALKPCIISLPLYGCDGGTTLHVTVQLLTSKTGFREFEQQREFMEKGLMSDQSNAEDLLRNQEVSRSKSKERFKESNPNEEDSSLGNDASSNTSGSQYTEKHELKTADSIDSTLFSANLGLHLDKVNVSDPQFSTQGTSDWVRRWTSESSGDSGTAAAYEENAKLRTCLEAAESSIIELKSEIDSLQSYADEINKEAHNLSSQLSSEISSGLELANEVSLLKTECSKLSSEFEEFKISNSYQVLEQQQLFQDLRREWVNGISMLEEKALDIRNKSSLGHHDRDYRFPHSDVESMLAILQNLKQEFVDNLGTHETDRFRYDFDMYQPDLGAIHCSNSQAPDSKIFELLREVDESKAESVTLKTKMDQMECYYEALVQELEENQKQLISQLQDLKNEHSTSMYVASSAKAEMEAICINMNEQIMQLNEDKCDLIAFNEKLEKRATSAESALKRARLNYSLAVNHLQKDLDLLSSQVASMFETSDGLVRQAAVGASTFVEVESQKPVEDWDLWSEKLCLDVFSVVLKRSMIEGVENSNGLSRKVEYMEDEIVFLKGCIGKLKGESESALQRVVNERSMLSQRVSEYEPLVTLYQRKVENLVEDKAQLSYLLENEGVTKGKLEKEVQNLREELEETKERFKGQIGAMKRTLESSNMLMQNLDDKMVAIVEKLGVSLEFDSEAFHEFFSSLVTIEDELLKLTDELERENYSKSEHEEEALRSSLEFLLLKECFKNEYQNRPRRSDSDAMKLDELAGKLSAAEELINELTSWNIQLNFKNTLLEEKLEDQADEAASLIKKVEELRDQHDDVSRKLHEQTVKTEEIAGISQRFREQAREKKEAAGGESLRMAFMKEQHETRLGELTQQVSISKKQTEDMLVKLQDMVDEIEARKRSEAVLIKRNEELGMHILDLEAELQTILADKREKVNAFDSLREQNEQLQFDLEFVKSLLQRTKPDEPFPKSSQPAEFLSRTQELNQSIQDMIACVSQTSGRNYQNGDVERLTAEFKSSIAHLTEELEKMKNEDSTIEEADVHNLYQKFPDLQDELLHLDRATQQLSALLPFEPEMSNTSALKRVLSLEINLAERLKSNAAFNNYEETMLKSFVDINDLIKETLETKRNYANRETELLEMQDRYTQLSLKFAEVEGERQKLMMNLKNTNRTIKKQY